MLCRESFLRFLIKQISLPPSAPPVPAVQPVHRHRVMSREVMNFPNFLTQIM